MSQDASFDIPLIVGVTGHRDIPPEDLPALEAGVQSCLKNLQTQYPSTPILILSGLAEGADRVVVRVAHEMGIDFAAILPFSESDYIKDFDTERSRTEFSDWMSRAACVHTLPDLKSPSTGLTDREMGYLQLGHYLATYSHTLLALWDGDLLEKCGGTSQVVRLVLKGQRHEDPLPMKTPVSLERPVFHLSTRRLSRINAPMEANPGTVNTLWPTESEDTDAGWIQQIWHDTIERVGQFNQDAKSLRAQEPVAVPRCRNYLLGADKGLDDLDATGKVIANLFAVNDALSMKAQGHRRVTFIGVILLALVAVIALQAYGFFPSWLLLVVILLFGSGSYALFMRGERHRLEETYLEYRALAEGLRVQFFWHVAGIHKNVADDFLRDQRDDLEWLHLVLQYTVMRGSGNPRPLPPSWVMERWFTDQRRYFIGDARSLKKGQAVAEEIKSRQLTKWMKASFFTGLSFFVIGAVIQENWLVFMQPEWKSTLVSPLLVSASCFMCIVPAIKVYSETMAFEEHARRYWRMGRYYQGCERRLSDYPTGGNVSLFNRILVEAGEQALIENGDWLLLHRQRPVRVPVM